MDITKLASELNENKEEKKIEYLEPKIDVAIEDFDSKKTSKDKTKDKK